MLVVAAFHPGDQHLALECAKWISELGGVKGHQLILIADTRCGPATKEIHDTFAKSFDSVELLPFVDHFNSWPRSPNACWSMAAKHIARTKKQPWLWLEIDAVLLRASGFDEIALEYEQALKAGKWFLGDYVNVTGVAPHCSGMAVYPWDIFEHAGEALLAHETAWDSAGAAQIVPQMQRSELIMHVWKGEPFATWDDVQRRIFDVKPRACLYHADKAGSLYPLLRARRNPLPVVVLPESVDGAQNPALVELQALGPETDEARESTNSATGGSLPDSRGGQFICDIFEFRNGELVKL